MNWKTIVRWIGKAIWRVFCFIAKDIHDWYGHVGCMFASGLFLLLAAGLVYGLVGSLKEYTGEKKRERIEQVEHPEKGKKTPAAAKDKIAGAATNIAARFPASATNLASRLPFPKRKKAAE